MRHIWQPDMLHLNIITSNKYVCCVMQMNVGIKGVVPGEPTEQYVQAQLLLCKFWVSVLCICYVNMYGVWCIPYHHIVLFLIIGDFHGEKGIHQMNFYTFYGHPVTKLRTHSHWFEHWYGCAYGPASTESDA